MSLFSPRQQLRINRAAELIDQGGVVAYPTEAVWGLGCDPFHREAVAHILALKRRAVEKGLILLAADIEQLAPYLAGLDTSQVRQLEETWPGPRTWLIPNNGTAPDWVTGGRNTLAVRVSAHPVAAGLSRRFGGAIVSTSANPQGRVPAGSLMRVKVYFGNKVDDYVPGSLGALGKPTEIRNLLTGELIRAN